MTIALHLFEHRVGVEGKGPEGAFAVGLFEAGSGLTAFSEAEMDQRNTVRVVMEVGWPARSEIPENIPGPLLLAGDGIGITHNSAQKVARLILPWGGIKTIEKFISFALLDEAKGLDCGETTL